MVVRRLPRLRDDSVTPQQAFAGTFHVNETWSQLDAAYSQAASGRLPDPLPCEAYCHSLTDPSILSARLRDAGAQTLTVFGLHTPHSVFGDTEGLAERLTAAVLASLNSVLAEPIQDVLWTDAQSKPCIETTTTLDLQRTLGMTGGNIFHGALSWPFADNDDPLDTPARQWGVATDHERIWAVHQTVSDPAHVEAAKVLRRRHFSAASPVVEPQVQVRSLSDYDDALGVDIDGGVA